MTIVLWIRLDIPYQNDANEMRAVVGHCNDDETLNILVTDYTDNIPNIINTLKPHFEESSIETNEIALSQRMLFPWKLI